MYFGIVVKSVVTNKVLGIKLRFLMLILLSISSPTLRTWFRRSIVTSIFLIFIKVESNDTKHIKEIRYPSLKKIPSPVAKAVIVVIISNKIIK